MTTPRLLAVAVAALALGTPAFSQTLPPCYRADSDYDSVSIRYNRLAVSLGGSPVDVTARDEYRSQFGSTAMTWRAVYEVGANFQIRMGSARQLPFVPTRVTISQNANVLITVSGADLIEYPRSRDLPREYRINFGPLADLTESGNLVWSASARGEPMTARIETATGDVLEGTIRFSALGTRRMQADRMYAEESHRIQTGQCRIR